MSQHCDGVVGAQAIGVARAVEAFVVMAHDRPHRMQHAARLVVDEARRLGGGLDVRRPQALTHEVAVLGLGLGRGANHQNRGVVSRLSGSGSFTPGA